ncbi:unnamed protein product [Nezara viridula]|uniref:Odorant receptor n=1 Tax=Nezara viridula TaxID=85310 RepID=A0A9P0MSX7_NEZVI|nr:unnamed protein product [Nezara viridula]
MGIATSVERVLQKWNGASDEYSDIVMQREYRNFVHIIGLYPNVNKVGYFWSFFKITIIGASLLFHSIGLVVSTILLYDINFIYFSSALHYVFVVGISFFYNFHFNKNRIFLARYHSRMYLNFYDYHEKTTDEITELEKSTEVQKKRFMILPMFSACAAVCILLLAPILDKYGTFDFDIETSINFNLPLPMVYVFDSSTVAGYLVALTHQLLSAMLCGLIFGGCGYMYIVMVSSLSLQMKILIHRLDTIEGRALSMYEANYGPKPKLNDYDLYRDKRFSKCMDICLKRCVEHHKVILSNISELNDFASMPLFAIFFVAALIIALAMLGSSFWKVLPGNTIASLVLCGTEIAFLGTLSSLGQSITDLNEDIRTAIYGIKWYHCNKRFCMNIRILLVKTLEPVTFTACGLIKICYDTYANIINSAYSYYNIVSATGS